MNRERRKLIASAHALVDDAKALLEQARDEEAEYRHNLPESMAVKIAQADQVVDDLQDIIDQLDGPDFDQFSEGMA